jgi:TatD DNase family protein
LISTPVYLPGKLVSLEFHPWDLPEVFDLKHLPQISLCDSFNALGEIGLDKLRGADFAVQRLYFHALLALAADHHKPVVIHCVRAFEELFAALKPFPQLKILFHGFRSSPQMLMELWKRGVTVSFHKQIIHRPALAHMLVNAAGAFGFESDDDRTTELPLLLDTMADKYHLSNLEQITDQHFADFLEI